MPQCKRKWATELNPRTAPHESLLQYFKVAYFILYTVRAVKFCTVLAV